MSTNDFITQNIKTPDWSDPNVTLTRDQLNNTRDDIQGLISNTNVLNTNLTELDGRVSGELDNLSAEIDHLTEQVYSTGLKFVSNDDGTCKVIGIGDDCTDTNIVIPRKSPDGDLVTHITPNAFSNKTSILSIHIPNCVTFIGDQAFFNCTGLTSIVIPDSVTSIGSLAFQSCSGLTSVITSKNVTSIGTQAFYGCTGLTSVTIPDSVTTIGSLAFGDCTSLPSVTMGNGVTSIGNYAFQNCTGLKSVTMGNGVTSIGDSAFYNCTGLTSITIPDGVTEIGGSAFRGCTSLTSIVIPDSVTSIGSGAFNGCISKLLTIYAAAQEKPEGWNDSWNMTNMKVVYGFAPDIHSVNSKLNELADNISNEISAEIDSLADQVYSDGLEFTSNGDGTCYVRGLGTCTDTDIIIPRRSPEGDVVTSVGASGPDYVLNNAKITSVVIPDSITNIGYFAFTNCTGLKHVNIPDSVTSIGSHAFSGCTGLTHIKIPNGVTELKMNTFSGCTSLKSVILPEGLKKISTNEFGTCTSLTYIKLPGSLEEIGSSAFNGCTQLASITIPSTTKTLDNNVFKGCKGLTIYAEASEKPANWATGWNSSNRPVVWGAAADIPAVNNELSKKADDYCIEIYNGNAGDQAVKFLTVNYSTCGPESGVAVKLGMVSGHGNGISYTFLQDAILKVFYDGTVSVDNFKYYDTAAITGYNGHNFGDICWVHNENDTTVDFYCVMGQYARLNMTPYRRVTYSTGGTIAQYNTATVYSVGTLQWGNNNTIATKAEIANLQNQLSTLVAASVKLLSGVTAPTDDIGEDGDLYLVVEE